MSKARDRLWQVTLQTPTRSVAFELGAELHDEALELARARAVELWPDDGLDIAEASVVWIPDRVARRGIRSVRIL
jgi:hypothetical protein